MPPITKIKITLDGAGIPNCVRTSAEEGRRVEWSCDDQQVEWEVEFEDDTPFHGRHLESGGPTGRNVLQGKKRGAPYKYSVQARKNGNKEKTDPDLDIT
jgi:hypothetical protein